MWAREKDVGPVGIFFGQERQS